MTKKYGNLWHKMIAMENIALAHKKARKHKAKRKRIIKVDEDLDTHLKIIQHLLVTKTFKPSAYRTKIIREPKVRTIYILPYFPDQIVHHVALNILEPIWESLFIDNSFACRVGKGQHIGSKKCMEYTIKYKYALKCDIRKFYPSINHAILKTIIRDKIKDKDVLWLLDTLIDSIDGEVNVPIGNYTSQWFGNLYMNKLDMYVKHVLKAIAYIRYSDDFIIFSNDKKFLHECADKIEDFLHTELQLTLSKCRVFPTTEGLDFLGYRHFPNKCILVRKSTAKRIKKRLKHIVSGYNLGYMTIEQARGKIASADGWMKHANCYHLKLKVDLENLKKIFKIGKYKDLPLERTRDTCKPMSNRLESGVTLLNQLAT